MRTPAGSRCAVLRSDPPFTFRETSLGLSWVGTAAGPVGGDDLGLDLEVAAGAELRLGSVAASLVLPGPSGHPSSTTIGVRVGTGASLRWQPRPAVLVRGCDHRASVTIALAAGARLHWREEVVLGRHEEPPGSIHQRLRVDVAGAPLLRNDLTAGPRWPGSLGPAGTAGARAVGTLLLVGWVPTPARTGDGVRLAAQALGGGATLVTAVADRPVALTAALDAVAGGHHEASPDPGAGRGGACCSSGSSSPSASSPSSPS